MCFVCRHTDGDADSVWLRVRRRDGINVFRRHRPLHHPLHTHLRPSSSPRPSHASELLLWWRPRELLSLAEHHCPLEVVDVDSTTFGRVKCAVDTSTIRRHASKSVAWRVSWIFLKYSAFMWWYHCLEPSHQCRFRNIRSREECRGRFYNTASCVHVVVSLFLWQKHV